MEKNTFTFIGALIGALIAHVALAQENDGDEGLTGTRLEHRAWADAQYTAWSETHNDSKQYWIKPGLLADRASRTITLLAESTGLTPDDPIEFILISDTSGHDYEALAVSYARPKDVHDALTFIGVDPGQPFNPAKLRYRPKGERIMLSLQWEDDSGQLHQWNAEDLLFDYRSRKALPVEGFVFTGSQWIDDTEGKRVYAAEQLGPQSIVSTYNEPSTVMDTPRDVPQSDVYGHIRPHKDRQPPANTQITVTLTPEFPAGEQRVMDVRLELGVLQNGQTSMTLTDRNGEPLHEGHEAQNVLAALGRLDSPDKNVYVELVMTDAVSLGAIREALAPLQPVLYAADMPIEPPRDGHLFYRSFFPNEDHRSRENRPSQVLEWHVTQEPDGFKGELIHVEENIEREPEDPRYEETTWDASTPAALQAALEEAQHRLPVLLTFAPSDMLYADLMSFLAPTLDTHNTHFIFLD